MALTASLVERTPRSIFGGQRLETGEVEHHRAIIRGIAVSMVIRPNGGCYAGELVVVGQMRGSHAFRVKRQPIKTSPVQSLSIESIKDHLSETLPAYMWPTAFVEIVSLPFVPSMKIDRRLVDSWLKNMISRPEHVANPMLADLAHSHLDPSEITANAIRIKFAELVASRDWSWQQKLGKSDCHLQKASIDSIRIVSLSMFPRKASDMKISISTLLDSKMSIRKLADLVGHGECSAMSGQAHTSLRIRNESRSLRERLFRVVKVGTLITGTKSHDLPLNVFLIGASGYLGVEYCRRESLVDIVFFASSPALKD